jgi:hypothetical protein
MRKSPALTRLGGDVQAEADLLEHFYEVLRVSASQKKSATPLKPSAQWTK